MPVDPAPYLSTVILASAALVAIVGGLLVARFVGLDSDQQTSIKLIGDASDRLDIARRRAEAAWESLVRWRAQDFLDDTDVAAALAQGETDAATLRALSRTRLTDDELGIVISQAAADIAKLEEWMAEDAVSAHIRDADYRWHDFQRDDMPQLSYPQLAVSVFETFAEQLYNDNERQRKEEEQRREEERQRAEEEEQRQAAAMGLGGLFGTLRIPADVMSRMPGHRMPQFTAPRFTTSVPSFGPGPSTVLIDANRHDELIATAVRTSQRVEDLEEELRRLRHQHADVVRPDRRLWWAVAILTAYAIAGVGVPLWVMASGPVSLSAVRWTFWPFAAGLAALIGYISIYLAGLNRKNRK